MKMKLKVVSPLLFLFISQLFPQSASATAAIFKGADGNIYATGLSDNTSYKISNSSGQTITATADSCGMIRIRPGTRFSGVSSDGATVKSNDGSTVATAATLSSNATPICRNGVFYLPGSTGTQVILGLDGYLYTTGMWNNTRLVVENSSSKKPRILQADNCGKITLPSNSSAFPLKSSDSIKVGDATTPIAISDLSNGSNPVCNGTTLSPTPANAQFKSINPDGSFRIQLTGFTPSEYVTIEHQGLGQTVNGTSDSCGILRTSIGQRFSAKPGDSIKVYAPGSSSISAQTANLGQANPPICRNGVVYVSQ